VPWTNVQCQDPVTDTPRTRFTLFCSLSNYHHANGACFPAQVTWLIEWLCSLAGTIKVKTMKLYLLGLKSYQLDSGIECTMFSDPRLERTLQGIKRDHNEPDRRDRTPLTPPCLLQILSVLGNNSYNEAVTHAAFSLAFAAFLRVAEFTYRQADIDMGPLFRNWFLTKNSIQLKELRGKEFIELTLPASKMDPFRHGIQPTIAASNDAGSPVRAMKPLRSVDTHSPQFAPLFCVGLHEQRPFTREYVVQTLQGLAIVSGLGRGAWNGHSFRRRAATWAAEVGIGEAEIQTLGRWRSDTYKAYIEYSREERIQLSQHFQRAQRLHP